MTLPTRSLARAALLLIALGGIVGLGALAGRLAARPAPRAVPVDGAQMTAVRHVGWDDGWAVRFSAAAVALRRIRVGPFRLGFARELVARDVDVDLDASGPRRHSDRGARAPWGAFGQGGALTRVRVDGFRVRARRGGAVFEMAAREAEIGWMEGERARFRGPVRIRGEALDLTLPDLAFDPRLARFVASTPAANASDVARVNAALARVGDSVAGRLARLASRVSPAMRP